MKKFIVFAAALGLLGGSFADALAQPRYEPNRPPMGEQHDNRRDHPDWRRGARMHHNDWQRGRRVDYREYRQYRLRRPPRGYEWREIDGRFVLGVIATGIIADIIIRSR
jgi:Ni/Co efflux regulator RcnB